MSVFTNSASSSAEEVEAYVGAVLGLVEGRDPIGVLRQTPQALRDATAALGAGDLRTPEAPGKWSINEVLQHLADSDLVFGSAASRLSEVEVASAIARRTNRLVEKPRPSPSSVT